MSTQSFALPDDDEVLAKICQVMGQLEYALYELDFAGGIQADTFDEMNMLLFSADPLNEFVDPRLEGERKRLVTVAQDFLEYYVLHTAMDGERNYPTKHFSSQIDLSKDAEERMNNEIRTLNEKASEVWRAYQTFIRNVRKIRFKESNGRHGDIHNDVKVIPWQEGWTETFSAEKGRIEKAFSKQNHVAEILHVGSTSLAGMSSKDIIDILICPAEDVSPEELLPDLKAVGYINLGECGRPGRYFLTRGDKPGETFYAHLCHKNHPVAKDQLLFQKLELENPTIFYGYRNLKLALAEAYPHDRTKYRDVKGNFISAVLNAYRMGSAYQAAGNRDNTQQVSAYQAAKDEKNE